MKPIVPPVNRNSQGTEVTNLQDGLLLLLLRQIIKVSDGDRPEYQAGIRREQVAQVYDDFTQKVVAIFQKQFGLRTTGEVDAPTAEQLNQQLKQLGAFDPEQPSQFVVRGRVFDSDRNPIRGILVRAFDRDVRTETRLGETITGEEGEYEIRYSAEQFRQSDNERGGADLIVKVYDAQDQIVATSSLIRDAKAEAIVDMIVKPQQSPESNQTSFIVQGQVRSRSRAGMNGLRVVIVDKNVGQDFQIATTTTNEQGNYQVRYKPSVLQQRKQKPDLQARIFAGETFLAASAVRYNASSDETLDVLLPETADAALASEHQILMRDLTAQFRGNLRDLQETDDRQDITYLANKTGWDARAVAIASLADQFSARTVNGNGAAEVEPAFFYVLFRAGIPANENALYQVPARTAETIWQKAIEQGVIPVNLKDRIPQVQERFQTLAASKILERPAVAGVSSLKEMLAVTIEKPAEQEQFARLYTQHRGEPAQFWKAVQSNFGEAIEQRLRIDGQLGYLTLNNAPLIRKLHETIGQDGSTTLTRLVENGYYQPENWQKLIGDSAVPAEVPGKDAVEKRTRYSELLAAQVRLSFPTAVMAQRVKNGETPLSNGSGEKVAAFLTEQQGKFEIGMQPVEQYLARNQLQLEPEITQEVKRLQRVYQITPSDRVMNTLLSNGLDSAYAIVNRYDRDEFVQSFKEDLGEEMAHITYAKSQQVHNIVLNLATSYLTTHRAPAVGLNGQILNSQPLSLQRDVAGDVIAYPTLENLLGEMDYCTCEHCRSILSPAAYLVDLLLFCDRPINELENPQTVLLERRPDIQHLPLTCENTNTPLPYIDLVNETLEYFVTHNLSLTNYKGHSTEADATPEELLASPQFVSDTAYTTLAAALFPAPLPFHQPLENLRRYFEQFEIPLAQGMETLRKNEAIDRATSEDYGWRDILMEELNLSRVEYGLLSDRTLTLQQLYGFTPATSIATVLSTLANAKTFARRVGISYDDLFAILRTRFINPNADLIPKLERLGVPFSTLKALKDGTITEAQFDALLNSGVDAAQYGGNIKAWIKNDTNYAKIMGLLVLTNPTLTNPATADLCQFDQLELRYAKPDNATNQIRPFEYVRLIRFIRLWKKLGWTIEQTDKAISALYPAAQTPNDADDTVNLQRLDTGFLALLPRLGYLKQVMRLLNLNLKKDLLSLLACFAAIDTQSSSQGSSLYQQMFLSPALLKQDPIFAEDGYGNFLQRVDLSYTHSQPTLAQAILDAAPNQIAYSHSLKRLSYAGVMTAAIQNALKAVTGVTPAFQTAIDQLYTTQRLFTHTETLRAAFRLTSEEFSAIASALGFNADTPLTLDNLSHLFRRGWLARKLKLSVREFLLLTQLTGLNPFAVLDPVNPPMLSLIELINRLRQVSLKPVQALYLIWNQDISGKSIPPQQDILEFVRTARTDLTAIEREFALTSDPDGQIARSRMALVYGNEATDFFFGLLNKTLTTSVAYSHTETTLAQAILDAAPGQIAYDDFRKQLSVAGVLSTATRDALKAVAGVPALFQTAVDSLYAENQQVINPFFDRYPELQPLHSAFVASTDPVEKRRSDLLASFLPELKRRRKQQMMMQSMSATAAVDVSFASALLNNPIVLHAAQSITQPALNDLIALENRGLSARFFFRNTATGSVDLSRSAEANLNYATGNNPLPANSTPANPISGIWSGYLEAPENGFYHLRIEADAGATVTLNLGGIAVPLTQNGTRWSNSSPIEFKAGTLYPIELRADQIKNTLNVRWQTIGRGWEILPAAYLYSATLTDAVRTVYLRFLKVTALATTLKLTAAETAYFAAQSAYQINGAAWLNRLPVTGSPDNATATALLAVLNALLTFAAIKADLSPDDERLLTVLQNPAAAAQTPTSLLFSLTQWEPGSLTALLTRFNKSIAELSQMATFDRLYDAFQIVKQLGIPAAALMQATTNQPSATTVRNFQSALRARYDETSWLQVLKPINDRMRSLQRDALVAYILHQMGSNPATAHINTPDKLFEYFLMDVQMEPCMQTSRIRHALSSVQLFIERCLMNLEPRVAPSSFKTKERQQWVWMKRYRVWEANRKVFLYPENWLEPELRDDQSPFFKEAMSELLQGDITEDRAAGALLNYLSKLEEVAKLEPCGIHYVENDPGTIDDIAHVVARTTGASRKYFYRRREYGYWTPWEQIRLDIEDNPVLPVIWNDRLFLFWLRILKQAPLQPPALPSDPLTQTSPAAVASRTQTQMVVQAILCWSEHFNGKWQPVRTSDIAQPLTLGQYDLSGNNAFDRAKLQLSALFWTNGSLRIIVSNEIGAGASFFLYNTHSSPELRNEKKNRHFAPKRIFDLATDTLKISYPNSSITQSVLNTSIADRIIEPHHPLSGNPWDAPFFYEDSRHVFYVRTAEKMVLIPQWSGYGIGDGGIYTVPSKRVDLPPLVLEPSEILPNPIDPVIKQPGFGVVDSLPIERYITEDVYIKQGIGTAGTIKFGEKEIGPAGSQVNVIRT